jgi:hypothetical protein
MILFIIFYGSGCGIVVNSNCDIHRCYSARFVIIISLAVCVFLGSQLELGQQGTAALPMMYR